jgi:hypothetical protein
MDPLTGVKRPLFRRIGLRRIALFISAAVVGVALLVANRPAKPSIEMFPMPAGWPNPKPTVLNQLARQTPMWFWRLKQAVVGVPRRIDIDSIILEVEDDEVATGSWPPLQFVSTNDLRAWVLGQEDLRAMRKELPARAGSQIVSRPRMSTAHGVQGILSTSENRVVEGQPVRANMMVDLAPHIGRDSTVLTTILSVSEATASPLSQPNTTVLSNAPFLNRLEVALRLTIPHGSGVMILGPSYGEPARRLAVILSPTLPSAAK